ncbi:hypothetical protein Scep_029282 [Stephania cephalantha]|uniref:Uncharacterized protein n=1 Tax=Stephania cephalantha TaxID=152367 RepID=A0AAP0DXF0_9MAGN
MEEIASNGINVMSLGDNETCLFANCDLINKRGSVANLLQISDRHGGGEATTANGGARRDVAAAEPATTAARIAEATKRRRRRSGVDRERRTIAESTGVGDTRGRGVGGSRVRGAMLMAGGGGSKEVGDDDDKRANNGARGEDRAAAAAPEENTAQRQRRRPTLSIGQGRVAVDVGCR